MAKVYNIQSQIETHKLEITQSTQSWLSLLSTASRTYKYSFDDNIAIHLQYPNAIAVADIDVWTKKMFRWVNRGAKSIALFHDDKVDYVFDIQDTHKGKNGRTPFFWQIDESNEKAIISHLIDTYDLQFNDNPSLDDVLYGVAQVQANDRFEDFADSVIEYKEDTSFPDMEDDMIRLEASKLLTDSIYYTLCRRCGLALYNQDLPQMKHITADDFESVSNYNNISLISALGATVMDSASPVLIDISNIARQVYHEHTNERVAQATETLYNTQERAIHTLNRERGERDGQNNVLSEGGLSVSEPVRTEERAGISRQVRGTEENISEGASSSVLRSDDAEGNAGRDVIGNGRDSDRESTQDNSGIVEDIPRSEQERGFSGIRGSYEQSDRDGGGDGNDGTGVLKTNETIIESENEILNNETEEVISSVLSLPTFPTVEEQKRSWTVPFSNRTEFNPSPFTADVVDNILRSGGLDDDSQLRLIYYYMIEQPSDSLLEKVKGEFFNARYDKSINGKGFIINDMQYSTWADESGLTIVSGDTVDSANIDSKLFLSWDMVTARIGTLLSLGLFASQETLNSAVHAATQRLADSLIFLQRDVEAEFRDSIFTNPDIFQGGFPTVEGRITELLGQPEFVEVIREQLTNLVNQYNTESENVMRFPYNDPNRVMAEFLDFTRERTYFRAFDNFEWVEPKYFITQDEINVLVSSSTFVDQEYRTYIYFLEDHTDKEKTEFVKNEFGTGGSSSAWIDTNYSGKGFTCTLYNQNDSVTLSWGKVAHRIDDLIKNDDYLSARARSGMAEYDRKIMARRIESFCRDMPDGLALPFDAFTVYKAESEIAPLLDDYNYNTNLLLQLQTLFESAERSGLYSNNPELHNKHKQLLDDFNNFIYGNYTVFPHEQTTVEVFSSQPEIIEGEQISLFDNFSAIEETEETPRFTIEQIADDRFAVLDHDKGDYLRDSDDNIQNFDTVNDARDFYMSYEQEERDFNAMSPEDRAITLMSRFVEKESALDDGEIDTSDRSHILILDTIILTGEENIGLQVFVDLVHPQLTRLADDVVFDTREYDSVEVLIENELNNLDFSNLASLNGYDIEQGQPEEVVAPTEETTDSEEPVSEEEIIPDDPDELLIANISNDMVVLGINPDDFVNGQWNVILSAARRDLNYDFLLNPDLSLEEMQGLLEAEIQVSAVPVEEMADEETADSESSEEVIEPVLEKINYRITDDDLGVGGPKAKFRMNMDAIQLLKTIESEGRQATAEEQVVLSKYVGWGGIPQAFDENNANWTAEYNELKNALTDEEYADARSSTLNAFYTPPVVIRAMYQALNNMGLSSGNILEPSCGVGNFMGLIPEDSMSDIHMYGVELDDISGHIAQQLYQQNHIVVSGFENTAFPDNFFDCAIGNVPFGTYHVNDQRYKNQNFLIHDYFIAKSLDLVRPGGVVAFITSSNTMDKRDPSVREYIARRADLLGAIRLPNDAFTRNAGTHVVADILFLQKREGVALEEPDWVNVSNIELDNERFEINSYFKDHPEMVLGTFEVESTQYGRPDCTVSPIPDIELADSLASAIKNIHGEIRYAEIGDNEDLTVDTSIPADPTVENFSYALIDGYLYYRENSRMDIAQPTRKADVDRIKGMVEIRDTLREVFNLQLIDVSDEELQPVQERLNELYDNFTLKFGLINSDKNRKAFSKDNSYNLIAALEDLDDDGNLLQKADVFTKRTIRKPEVVESVDTASDALIVSINETGKVDLPFMASLSSKTEDELITELNGVIFQDPLTDEWQPADEYLSGNVREKLHVARDFAERDSKYNVNVTYLEQVLPEPIEAGDIEVRLGATWIDPKYIEDFMKEVFHTPDYRFGSHIYGSYRISVNYTPINSTWEITGKNHDYGNSAVYHTYGTKRRNAYELLEDALNLKPTKVYDYVEDPENPNGNKKRVLNRRDTMLAQQKKDLIKDEFQNWIFKDVDRRERLTAKYNEMFNSIRPREFNGEHIQFDNMNNEITLAPHQKDAVARVLYNRTNTMLAHAVGAGKTFEMVAAAMELSRLHGYAWKNMFVVPNHIIEQWGNEFMRLYPNANILVARQHDFEPSNRKQFCSRIATGNYDAIIIGHSQFEKIPLSPEHQISLLEKEINDIVAAIDSSKSKPTIKQLEKTRKSLETRLTNLLNAKKKDNVIYFEQLGINHLFVDESQNYKNLEIYTKMQNVAGVQVRAAQKSTDLFMKCRYMDTLTGGCGVTFATGTPISNSMSEMYVLMRYLLYDTLQDMGLGTFDAWASVFGETTTAVELAPEGTGFRVKTRFSRFFNLPELTAIFKECADIKTSDVLNLPIPEVEYINSSLKPSEIQKHMVETYAERAESVRNGDVDPWEDNMLKITNDGRKCGLDQRLINPEYPDEDDSKVNLCVENVFKIWQETAMDKSTQMIFCDLSTPKNDGTFNIYDDVRNKLVAMGIPKEEIAFIHEAKNGNQKDALFTKVRNGSVRVLLGSTEKVGTGTNIQDRMIAMHHLDVPWRPSDLEQREGRILRQGNTNKTVQIYRYVTEGTFDAYMWQLLESKQRFISQIMTSKSPVRSANDVDEAVLNYAEIKALATGNPLIKEKMELDIDVDRLKIGQSQHRSQIYALESDIAQKYPEEIKTTEERIQGLQADLKTVNSLNLTNPEMKFELTVGDKTFDERKMAGEALLAACSAIRMSPTAKSIGSCYGFDLSANFDPFQDQFLLTVKGAASYTIELGKDPVGCTKRIQNVFGNVEKYLEASETHLTDLKNQFEIAKEEVKKPFPYEEELKEKQERLYAINAKLGLKERDTDNSVAFDDKSAQSASMDNEDVEEDIDEKQRFSNETQRAEIGSNENYMSNNTPDNNREQDDSTTVTQNNPYEDKSAVASQTNESPLMAEVEEALKAFEKATMEQMQKDIDRELHGMNEGKSDKDENPR